MNDRCEVADIIIEITMLGDAKNKTEGHETVPTIFNKIIVRRPVDKGRPDQGVYETFNIGMTQ